MTTPAAPTDSSTTLVQTNIQHNLALLSRAVDLFEPRFTTRALRSLPALRKKVGAKGEFLAETIRAAKLYDDASPRKDVLIAYLGNPASPASAPEGSMEVDPTPQTDKPKNNTINADDKTTDSKPKRAPVVLEPQGPLASELPEGDVYVSLLVVTYLVDQANYADAKKLVEELLATITALNRRTMDQLASKVYFYWVRVHELAGEDTAHLRTGLLAAQRTASLRGDVDLLATLLPLLLRNYLAHGLYDQADRLVARAVFPDATAGNGQLARWGYYVGRVRAIQLNYSEANSNLQQAIRRAPEAKVAPGFVQTATKLGVLVELLMGEIPERKTFRDPVLKASLAPYLAIAQAVRVGSLTDFEAALATHTPQFTADSNLTLVLRLRHNVIKTALRTISKAYSRIPLSLVAQKLRLESEEDAEYIVAKAIRDGVVDAEIDHARGEMRGREAGDVYATSEPQGAFDERIKFLLGLHATAQKAMRYPLAGHAKELARANEASQRERELASEIAEAEDDDVGGDDMDF